MDVCKTCGHEKGYLKDIVKRKNIPFYCKDCGGLDFKLQATGDKVFLWPDALPEKVKADGVIIIPDFAKDKFITVYGTILSVGPGCYDKKKKRFVKSDIPVGSYVIYDNTVPWYHEMVGTDGKMHHLKIMGVLDIKCYAEE